MNGKWRPIDEYPPETTLLDWLRKSGLTGTKCGCAEGDCGACSILLADASADGRRAWRSINSCIALLPTLAGRELVTVEGLASGDTLHPAQAAMVSCMGSQCGYCTPGIVMSMVEAAGRPACAGRDPAKVADQLCGNLCRCTGYRPIRDAAMAAIPQGIGNALASQLDTAPVHGEPCAFESGAKPFARPGSLDELFTLRADHPGAALVCGATELGVEVNKRFRRLPALISLEAVRELRVLEKSETTWRIGAAVPLTEIEDALGGEFPIFDEMLHVFASRQIRNRASLGGNLVTASPIGDSAPVLIALGASVELVSPAGARTVPLDEFFTGYRTTCMAPDEILSAVLIPRGDAPSRARFFKISKRREMDISIVSAAFALHVDDEGRVTAVRMAFGGVAATPWVPSGIADRLIGKTLDDDTIDAVAAALTEQVSPLSDVRGGADYRRAMVAALWRKFCSGELGEPQDLPLGFVPGASWGGDDPSRFRSHESAVGHVTGRAQYVDDQAVRRRMATLWPVCAPHARAKILRIDTSAAETMPGVLAVLTAADVPGVNDVGCSRKDEPLLPSETVEFYHQPVAVIVGESETACRAAAAAVVVEYEPLTPVLDIRAAIEADSWLVDEQGIRRGDCAAALADAPRRLSGEFEFGGQEHFYLETHAAWAEVTPEGDVFVSSSTQHPTEIQIIVAQVLGLSRNRVVVEAPRMGGGFGGKETQGNAWASLAALAAHKTGRPVRVQMDRDLDMELTGKRHGFHARFEVGFDDDGLLLGAKVHLISDGGWSLDLSLPILNRALFHLDNAYFIPAVEFTGRAARTNTVSNTAFRGFGGPQGMLVIEEILGRVAQTLGLPPEIVRERNLYRGSGPTNTTHYGQDVGDNRIRTIWSEVMERSDFSKRRAEISAWNAANGRIRRGLAITPVKFGISFTFTPYNQAGALVLAYADGTVQVNHGGTEMGQGLHTKILGIAMRELGLPAERIRLMFTRTDKVPNTSATAASSGADLNGAAVLDACRKIKSQIRPVAVSLLEPPEDDELVLADGRVWFARNPSRSIAFAELCAKAHHARVPLSSTGYYRTPEIHWDAATGKGRPFYYFACGASVAEVEVDGWTGMHRVRRVDIVHDVGDSLNPGVDRGQIEGGFVQGMGWLTREELKWNPDGRLLSHSASTYAIPAFSDAPADLRVHLLERAAQPGVVHGSKAVGEPPLMLAISVREAIRDAVASFAPDRVVTLACPATAEAIWRAVEDQSAES